MSGVILLMLALLIRAPNAYYKHSGDGSLVSKIHLVDKDSTFNKHECTGIYGMYCIAEHHHQVFVMEMNILFLQSNCHCQTSDVNVVKRLQMERKVYCSKTFLTGANTTIIYKMWCMSEHWTKIFLSCLSEQTAVTNRKIRLTSEIAYLKKLLGIIHWTNMFRRLFASACLSSVTVHMYLVENENINYSAIAWKLYNDFLKAKKHLAESDTNEVCSRRNLPVYRRIRRTKDLLRSEADAAIKGLSLIGIMGLLLTCVSLPLICHTAAISFSSQQRCHIHHRTRHSKLRLIFFKISWCSFSPLTVTMQLFECSCKVHHNGTTFTICISCVLWKAILVLMPRRATFPGQNIMEWFGPPQHRHFRHLFIVIQVRIYVLWLMANFFNNYMAQQKEKLCYQRSDPESAAHIWALLGYLNLVAISLIIMTFIIRKTQLILSLMLNISIFICIKICIQLHMDETLQTTDMFVK